MVEGVSFSRGVLIISKHWQEIAKALMEEIHRGVTSFQGKGLYTNEQKEVLFCVFSPGELGRVKEIILEMDENAFVLVTDMREVLGEGFHKI